MSTFNKNYKLNLFIFFVIILIQFFTETITFATTSTPGLNYQGRLLTSTGDPVNSTNVSFDIKIKSVGTVDCVLYEETHLVDMSSNPGHFSLTIGKGSRVTLLNPTLTFEKVFSNKGTIPCGDSSSINFTPNKFDGRSLSITFSDGTTTDSLPPLAVNFVPSAIEAEQIAGYSSEQIIKVKSDVDLSANLNQTEFNSTQWNELLSLINGTSNNYLKSSEAIGSFSGDVTGAYNATKVVQIQGIPILNTAPSSGQFLAYDGTQYKPISISGDATLSSTGALTITKSDAVGITSITVGSDLTADGTVAGTITSNGTIDIKDSGVTAGTYPKVTVNTKGLVLSGSALVESDIPSLSSAGKVSGSAITSGTIGGTTDFNSSGSITTSGNVTSTNVSTNNLSTNNIYSPSIYGGTASGGNITISSTSSATRGNILLGLDANEKIGIGTNSPVTKLDVNGPIKFGTTATACSSALAGTQRYNLDAMEFCNGTTWTPFGSGSGSGTVTNVATGTGLTGGPITSTGTIAVDVGTSANQIVQLDASSRLPAVDGSQLTGFTVSQIPNLDVSKINTGTLPITRGGTNSSTTLLNNRIMVSSGGAIVEGSSLNDGQILIGNTGAAPTPAYLTGTVNQITVTNSAGAISLSTPQNINSGASPTFSGLTLSGMTSVTSNAKVITANSGGTLAGTSCGLNQVLSFDGSGTVFCAYIFNIYSGLTSSGNTFGSPITVGSNDYYDLSLKTNNTNRLIITKDGFIGIGTYPSSSAALEIKGEVRFAGSTSGFASLRAPANAGDTIWTLPNAEGTNGQVLTTDGTGNLFWSTPSGGSGISSLNGLTGSAQTFSIGNAGNTPNWSSSGVNHSLNLPNASSAGVTAGLISKTDYDSFSSKLGTGSSFSGDVSGYYNSTSVDKIKGYVVSATAPTASGQVLRYDGTNTYIPAFLSLADIRSTVTPANTMFPNVPCTAAQTLIWSSLTDTMSCTNIAIPTTSVTGLGTAATYDVGSGANQVVKLDNNGALFLASLNPSGNTVSQKVGIQIDQDNMGTITGNRFAFKISSPTGGIPASNDYAIYQEGYNQKNYFAGAVGIGSFNPQGGLDINTNGVLSSIVVPRDTEANRPPVPTNGMIRYNTTNSRFEAYENGKWVNMINGYIGGLTLAANTSCNWSFGSTVNVWENITTDNASCSFVSDSSPTVTPVGLARHPEIKISNLSPGRYRVTFNIPFGSTSGSTSCAIRVTDSINNKAGFARVVGSGTGNYISAEFSYNSPQTNITYLLQGKASMTGNGCWIYGDDAGTGMTDFTYKISIEKIQ